jgi:hypothetical protein
VCVVRVECAGVVGDGQLVGVGLHSRWPARLFGGWWEDETGMSRWCGVVGIWRSAQIVR